MVYASSAGNDAETHYQEQYVDSGDGRGSHEISSGNNEFTVFGEIVVVVVQWSEQFGLSGDDYDLCLAEEEPTDCALFNNQQDGNGNPYEVGTFDCTLGCSWQVRLVSGSAQTLELFVLWGSLDPADQVAADSIFGHPAVPGALAVGAINDSYPGNDDIAFYSSRGPSTIFFPVLETRQKPDVAAIDGVSVTGAGGFPSTFFGTSASAPHVAGVAALLKGGFTTATDIVNALKISAVDLGTSGTDNTFGAGRIDAFAAAQQLNQPPNSIIDAPSGNVTITQGDSVNFTGTCTDPNSTVNMSFLWTFGAGSGIADATVEDPGSMVFANPGTFTVTFTCTDGFSESDPTPDTRIITVVAPNTSPTADAGGGASTGGGGSCFIATAAYGSYLNPHVQVLRDFRDDYLLTNPLGKTFVAFYYKTSPPIAGFIRKHESLRTATRWALTPVVYGVKYPGGALMVLLGLIVVPVVWRRRTKVNGK